MFQISTKERVGIHWGLSEFIATFGLLSVIALTGRKRSEMIPVSVAAYIAGAYWFTHQHPLQIRLLQLPECSPIRFVGLLPMELDISCSRKSLVLGLRLVLIFSYVNENRRVLSPLKLA